MNWASAYVFSATAILVFEFRQQINAVEIWDDYEWLAKEPKAFQKSLT
jgi:hypothetical protein